MSDSPQGFSRPCAAAAIAGRGPAGTANRDPGQYGSKLRTAITTRRPDSLVAEPADGRVIDVSYRNSSWVSTHEDVTTLWDSAAPETTAIAR